MRAALTPDPFPNFGSGENAGATSRLAPKRKFRYLDSATTP